MGIDGRSGKLDQWLGNGESHTAGVSWVGRSDGDGNVTVLIEIDTSRLSDTIASFAEELLLCSGICRSNDVLTVLPVSITVVSSSAAKCGGRRTPSAASRSAVGASTGCWSVPASSVAARGAVTICGGSSYRRAIGAVGVAIESRSGSRVSVDSVGSWNRLGNKFRSGSFEARLAKEGKELSVSICRV